MRRIGAAGLLTAVAVLVSVASLSLVIADQPPGENSAEAGFARDMSAHHAQAVEMAQIVQENTDDPEVTNLATDITLTQQSQIGRMQGWLSLWGLPLSGSGERMAWMGSEMDGRMPGMASSEKLNELRNAEGEEAERLFLQLMIPHHEAAIPMAEAVMERSDKRTVTELAQAIIASQRAEIQTMRDMLEQRGGDPPPQNGPMEDMEMDGDAQSATGYAGLA
ncbi:DUF305 domain-containing protein [Rubrobacter aplysinae]|uniref:DUF305 domain-containing protein n=1 Tax=Rubrobacter aplysinae TaxID=909625 RepID=UPI001F2D24CE|nr:DUF305 domain-containing protein [Rubrobacter aplysinae]